MRNLLAAVLIASMVVTGCGSEETAEQKQAKVEQSNEKPKQQPPPATEQSEPPQSQWDGIPAQISALPSLGTTRTEFEKTHMMTAKNHEGYIRYDNDVWHVQYSDAAGDWRDGGDMRATLVLFQNVRGEKVPVINLTDLLPSDAQILKTDSVGSDNMVTVQNAEGTSETLSKIFPESGGKFTYGFNWDAQTGEFIGGTIMVDFSLQGKLSE